MRLKVLPPVLFLVLLLFPAASAHAWDWELGKKKQVTINLRGDISYAFKLRTQAPYGPFVDWFASPGQSNTFFCTGDANFERGDLGNNALIGTLELKVDSRYLSFFGRFKPFVDFVYFQDSLYSGVPQRDRIDKDETQEHAAWNLTDSLEYYLEGKYKIFTGRIGRQIVQWGESNATVYAQGVNVVSPFFVYHVTSAGYTVRDYQVPTHMIWASLEPTEDLSLELVYAPDFDPRFYMPVVGTFASPADILGFGVKSSLVDDRRPLDFAEQQQGGGRVRMVFPSLGMFELGLYYYHYLDRFPKMTTPNTFPPKVVVEYPEMDMIGISFSQAIQSFGLNLQVGGELAYRPNDPLQKDYIPSPFMAAALGIDVMPDAGGWVRGHSLTWVLNGMRMFFDVLPFTPWTFQLTTMFEAYGKINLSYDEAEHFSDPQFTAYYSLNLPLTTSDMIDNTAFTVSFSAMGHMFPQLSALHNLIFETKARYGDHWELLMGYNLIIGNPQQDPMGAWMWDRDAFTLKLTYHFI